jgi:hypothetical protein
MTMRMLSTAIIMLFIGAFSAQAAEQQTIMGWVENVHVESIDSNFKAKLDTGATTSSMRATVLKVLDEQDDKLARVVFQVENDKGETNTLERKLIRQVKIKMRGSPAQTRPVVEMDFCVAGRHVIGEVNLAPRQDFIYPVLIGRNMLTGAGVIVDSSRTFTAPAHCAESKPKPEEETTPAALLKGE